MTRAALLAVLDTRIAHLQTPPALDSVRCCDWRDLLRALPDGSADMILSDLPYGVTACAWDQRPDLTEWWALVKRVIKPRGAIVMTASQPFTSMLVTSNLKWFRYEWIVNKLKASSFLDANRKPLKVHESVLVFGAERPNYYPQMNNGEKHRRGTTKHSTDVYSSVKERAVYQSDQYYPKSIVTFSFADTTAQYHATQKPVDLFAYLIRTYTESGALVVDPFVGSGTTAIAARNTGRHFIVGDFLPEYAKVTRDRLAKPWQPELFAEGDAAR